MSIRLDSEIEAARENLESDYEPSPAGRSRTDGGASADALPLELHEPLERHDHRSYPVALGQHHLLELAALAARRERERRELRAAHGVSLARARCGSISWGAWMGSSFITCSGGSGGRWTRPPTRERALGYARDQALPVRTAACLLMTSRLGNGWIGQPRLSDQLGYVRRG
jgi:hypothetical protein